LHAVPDENHEGGVGENEVGVEESFAIDGVAVEVFEGGSGGDDEETTVAQPFDGSLREAIKEVDPQYPMEVGVKDLTDVD
jgi:hypothetical protein